MSRNQTDKRNHEGHEGKQASGGRQSPVRCGWIDLLVALLISGGTGRLVRQCMCQIGFHRLMVNQMAHKKIATEITEGTEKSRSGSRLTQRELRRWLRIDQRAEEDIADAFSQRCTNLFV